MDVELDHPWLSRLTNIVNVLWGDLREPCRLQFSSHPSRLVLAYGTKRSFPGSLHRVIEALTGQSLGAMHVITYDVCAVVWSPATRRVPPSLPEPVIRHPPAVHTLGLYHSTFLRHLVTRSPRCATLRKAGQQGGPSSHSAWRLLVATMQVIGFCHIPFPCPRVPVAAS